MGEKEKSTPESRAKQQMKISEYVSQKREQQKAKAREADVQKPGSGDIQNQS
jgi:hypothetical protein